MKKMTVFFIALISAWTAYAEDATEPWYTPASGEIWKGTDAGVLKVKREEPDGNVVEDEYKVEADGTSWELDLAIDLADLLNPTLGMAYRAIKESLKAQVMVKNTSDNINALLAGGSASITSADGTSNGNYSFGWDANGNLDLTLSGVGSVGADRGLTKVDKKIGMDGWLFAPIDATLVGILTNQSPYSAAGSIYSKYEVLARTGPNGSLKYVKIGDGLSFGGGAQADGKTIATNATTKALELKGWSVGEGNDKSGEDKAKEGAPVIPYADSDAGLKWGRFIAFFGSREFESGIEDGQNVEKADWRVRLRGASAATPADHYFGTGDTVGEFGFHALPSADVDGRSVTTNETGKIQIVGVEDASDGEALFADGADGAYWGSLEPYAVYADDGVMEFYSYGQSRELVNWFYLPDFDAEEVGDGWKFTWWPLGGSMETTEEQELTIPKPPPPDESSISTNDAGSVEVKGWADAGKCGESLSGMLTEQSDEGRTTHELLARVKSGGTTSLHYVEIGNRLDVMPSPDGESVVTNGGKVAVYGWEANKAAKYAVPHTGGKTLAWRGFGDFFETATFDWKEATGKVAPKGYGSGVGNSHYFGTDESGGVGWWELPNVTTNYVEGDEITVTTTTDGDTKKVGLKGWNPNYGGSFPLFLVNDGGALGYYPLPEPITNEWDNASIYSNSQRKVEIKGFADGTPRCGANLYAMLTNTAAAYPDKGKHMLLSRYKDGNDDPVLHWIPFPEDALVTGGGAGAMAVDNESIGSNTLNKIEVKGYETTQPGMVPCAWYLEDRVSSEHKYKWLVWRHLPIADSEFDVETDGLPDYTRTIKHDDRAWVQLGTSIYKMRTMSLYGFEEAKDGMVPMRETVISTVEGSGFAIPQLKWSTGGNFAYTWNETSGGSIGAGAVTVGRQTYRVNVNGTTASSGNWRVKVVLSEYGGDPTITVESGSGFAASPPPLVSYFPLYELDDDGGVTADWRGTFVVPAYERGL